MAVCRAGVPSIIIPHLPDQFYWGEKLHMMGVAPKPLRRKDMTARRLADRIHAVMKSRVMEEKASTLGQKIGVEDGLTTAVTLIEGFGEDKGFR